MEHDVHDTDVLHLLGFIFTCFLHIGLYVAYSNIFQAIQLFCLLFPLQLMSHYS